MIKHKNQRVGVFIDVQNMYYSAKNLYNSKVDFGAILETAVAGRQLIRAIAYVVEATGEETPFFDALFQRGLETKKRPLQIFDSGAKKADWDVGIAVDAIRIGEILDVVILVTGDGDFVELVEYLKHHGRQVEAIAFGNTTATKLKEAVDDFTDLSKDLERYLIKPPQDGAKKNPQRGTSSAQPSARTQQPPNTQVSARPSPQARGQKHVQKKGSRPPQRRAAAAQVPKEEPPAIQLDNGFKLD